MDSSIYLMLPNKAFYFFHTSNGLESYWEEPTENQARDLRDKKQVWSISLSLSIFTMYLVFHLHFTAAGESSKILNSYLRVVGESSKKLKIFNYWRGSTIFFSGELMEKKTDFESIARSGKYTTSNS